MFQEIKYNAVKDLCEVDQFGFIDLREAFINNSIPASANVEDLDYNGIEDPSTIVGKPRDVFEAIDMNVSIKSNPNSYVPKDDED